MLLDPLFIFPLRVVVSFRYVRAVGERLVATRLAPYLADVLLVLDFNEFFERKE